MTGAEDGNWLHVQTSRARRETMLYAVVGPEPRDLELDEPPAQARTVAEQLAQGLRRDGGERLASDTTARLNLRQLGKAELRAERKRLAQVLRETPPDRARLLAHTTRLREQAEQARAQAARDAEAARHRVEELGRGPGALLHRHQLAQAREHAGLAATGAQLARGQAERATDRQREARHAQQRHLAWREGHAEDLAADRAVTRELAWQTRVAATAAELDRPPGRLSLASRPAACGAGGPTGRPPACSATTATATPSATPTGRSAKSPAAATLSSGARTGLARRRLSALRASSAPSVTGPTARHLVSATSSPPSPPAGRAHTSATGPSVTGTSVTLAERSIRAHQRDASMRGR